MELKKIQLIPRTLKAIQFTKDNFGDIKTWVEELSGHQIIANPNRMYLPVGTTQEVEILEPGMWVLWDPETNDFRAATDEAIQGYYIEVE